MRKSSLLSALLGIGILLGGGPLFAKDVLVTDFGAVGNGTTLNTKAFEKAIEQCAGSGGGRVIVPQGDFLSGTINLASHVEIYLERGARILGSVAIPDDYPTLALVYADGIEDCGLAGPGTIDGQSNHPDFLGKFGTGLNNPNRPFLVLFKDCRNVTVKDVHLERAGNWTLRLLGCDGVLIDGVTIYSLTQANNDGIDVEARNVRIANCHISSDDDGICLKNDRPDFATEYITVTNCVIASNCNPIKLGTTSYKAFRNITFSNITIRPTEESNVWEWSDQYRKIEKGTRSGLSGIAVECVDGGEIENVLFSNITMEGVLTPIFVCINHRHGTKGSIRNVRFSGISAKANGIIPCLIAGAPDSPIEGLVFRDIVVEQAGGEDPMTEPLPDNVNGYPENRMFGHTNPAGGMYIRHARNVHIDGFRVSHRERDHRPTVVLDDVQDFRLRDMLVFGTDNTNFVSTTPSCSNIQLNL